MDCSFATSLGINLEKKFFKSEGRHYTLDWNTGLTAHAHIYIQQTNSKQWLRITQLPPSSMPPLARNGAE
jgi:hypothetical protein